MHHGFDDILHIAAISRPEYADAGRDEAYLASRAAYCGSKADIDRTDQTNGSQMTLSSCMLISLRAIQYQADCARRIAMAEAGRLSADYSRHGAPIAAAARAASVWQASYQKLAHYRREIRVVRGNTSNVDHGLHFIASLSAKS